MLTPVLIGFKTHHLGVMVDLGLADRNVSLIAEGFDLVIRMGRVAKSGLMSKRIRALSRVLVASPAFLQAHPALTPETLGDVPVLATRSDLLDRKLQDAEGAPVILRPRIGFAANRQPILVRAATAELGVANCRASW